MSTHTSSVWVLVLTKYVYSYLVSMSSLFVVKSTHSHVLHTESVRVVILIRYGYSYWFSMTAHTESIWRIILNQYDGAYYWISMTAHTESVWRHIRNQYDGAYLRLVDEGQNAHLVADREIICGPRRWWWLSLFSIRSILFTHQSIYLHRPSHHAVPFNNHRG